MDEYERDQRLIMDRLQKLEDNLSKASDALVANQMEMLAMKIKMALLGAGSGGVVNVAIEAIRGIGA